MKILQTPNSLDDLETIWNESQLPIPVESSKEKHMETLQKCIFAGFLTCSVIAFVAAIIRLTT
jgi:hypothetical protein